MLNNLSRVIQLSVLLTAFSLCFFYATDGHAQTDELIRNNTFAQGMGYWNPRDAAVVSSELRTQGKALEVGTRAAQYFPTNTLLPGSSYKLRFKAKNSVASGSATIAINVRIPKNWELIRTYKVAVNSTAYDDYELNFTAPAYAAIADLVVSSSGTRTVVDSISLTKQNPISLTEHILSGENSYAPVGYELVFNDEFNGASLNTEKWFTRYIYANGTLDRLNDEQQRYRDNKNHVVSNGVLSLVARQVSTNAPNGLNYESGMIRSDWTSRYGYYEARVRMPGGKGVWPAFWLNSDASENGVLAWPPEIDIFEMVNNGQEDNTTMLHSNVRTHPGTTSELLFADTNFDSQWNFWAAPFDFSNGWHTIGAEWTAGHVTVFVDGRKIYTRTYSWNYNDKSLAGPAHIILNLAIGGNWAGRYGIDDTAFPQALEIDWVRAYRKRSNQ